MKLRTNTTRAHTISKLLLVPIVALNSYTLNVHRTTTTTKRGFPGGTVVKNPAANAGDMGSIPGLGRSHMSRSN